MSRPPPKVVTHVVATVPRGKREATIVAVSATDEAWAVDLWNATLFPDTTVGPRRCGLRLRPDQLRDVGAALISVADFRDAQARETATGDELAKLVEDAAAHNKFIVRAVASGAAVFLKALPDGQPFRVYVGQPSILVVLDAEGSGPVAFDYACLRAALRIAKLVVLTVEVRNVGHYRTVGARALQGDSGVIIDTTASRAADWAAMLAVEVPNVEVLVTEAGDGVAPARVLQ